MIETDQSYLESNVRRFNHSATTRLCDWQSLQHTSLNVSSVIITPYLLCCIWLVPSHTVPIIISCPLSHQSHNYCNHHVTVHRAGGDPCALHSQPAGHDCVQGSPSVKSCRSRVIGVSPRPRTRQKGVSRGALGVTVCKILLLWCFIFLQL